jgi:hypothetical protein
MTGSASKHQWVTFSKGRIKLLGCACCGQMQLPSNREEACAQTALGASPLVRNGYRCDGSVSSSAAA